MDERTERTNRGSFYRYLQESGGFVTHIAETIARADEANLARLKLSYPQMVAAHAMKNWDDVPDGFSSRQYDALPTEYLDSVVPDGTDCLYTGVCWLSTHPKLNPLATVDPRHILFCLQAEDIRSVLEGQGITPQLVDAMMADEEFIRSVKKGIESGMGEAQWEYMTAAIANTDWSEK